ncbi:glycosyltransferase [Candidatus Woesearchaeota archaeon]|nr:glycosyltransferase [Candidatus Woesearchaeota archaeon]
MNTTNNYTALEQAVQHYEVDGTFSNIQWQRGEKVSVIVTTYNQPDQLKKQLLALSKQTYSPDSLEVVIVDDGGKRGTGSSMNMVANMDLPFDVKYVWQEDKGFRLAKARNEAMRRASYDTVISIDCDMIMGHTYVEDVMKWHYAAHQEGTRLMTTQDRAFVEPEDMDEKLIAQRKLDQVKKSVSRRFGKKEDWRKEHYQRFNGMKEIPDTKDPSYFVGRMISGGNCSFSRADAFEAGLFDEDFTSYGAEDTEFGVRLYRHFNEKLNEKLYFVPVDTTAYHIEHGKSMADSVDQKKVEFFQDKVRKAKESAVQERPEVSVYMPTYNQERFIERAVRSVAEQNFDLSKLEIVVGQDGSTDRTSQILDRLQQEYEGVLTIRVVDDGRNHGLAENTNRTIQACRGKYILQLDGDDELLPNAVATLYQMIERNTQASVVFGDCIDRDIDTSRETPHWSCSEFTNTWYAQHKGITRKEVLEILQKGMRIHAPRMFRRDAFFQTEGVTPNLENAVDYDLQLKLAETGIPLHVKQPMYIYNVNHGNNTSKNNALQQANGQLAVDISRSTEKRKEVYIVDESERSCRTKHFDLVDPLRRANILHQKWQEEDQSNSSSLYRSLKTELEQVVSFFRWVQPERIETHLQMLLAIDSRNSTAHYYEATLHYSQGRFSQALDSLDQIESKGSSAQRLEEMIQEAMGAAEVA